MTNRLALILVLLCSATLFAQVAQPTPGRTSPSAVSAPASMTPMGPEMRALLSQLERTAERTHMDVGRLTINKWKTDSTFKTQAQHDVSSVQANITGTLPGLVNQVRTAPDNTAILFKLYRNVDALLEVVRGLAESTGAFGAKPDFEALQSDSQELASVRGSLAAQIDTTATAKESELLRVKNQLAQAQAAAPPPLPKKTIVDDNETSKKPVHKKKPAPKPATTGTTNSSQQTTTQQPH